MWEHGCEDLLLDHQGVHPKCVCVAKITNHKLEGSVQIRFGHEVCHRNELGCINIVIVEPCFSINVMHKDAS